jgi:hypothetical protein
LRGLVKEEEEEDKKWEVVYFLVSSDPLRKGDKQPQNFALRTGK